MNDDTKKALWQLLIGFGLLFIAGLIFLYGMSDKEVRESNGDVGDTACYNFPVLSDGELENVVCMNNTVAFIDGKRLNGTLAMKRGEEHVICCKRIDTYEN